MLFWKFNVFHTRKTYYVLQAINLYHNEATHRSTFTSYVCYSATFPFMFDINLLVVIQFSNTVYNSRSYSY